MEEDYVSFEIAKLLKEKGFKRWWCYKSYGTAVYYKGVPLSVDEEYDLISKGHKNEIEYVEGGYLYDFGSNNSDDDMKAWAAPTLQRAMKWLREIHHYYIQVMLDSWACGGHTGYYVVIQRTDNDFEMMLQDAVDEVFYQTYEEACEAAIKYCLENLI